jgi:hypothetical protein
MFSKKKDEKNAPKPQPLTELEQLCADDKETYEALLPVMFLDPRKIETTVKQAADNAKRLEKDNDFVRARMWYEVAGGLSLYEGNAKKVAEYYGSAEEITGAKYLILKNPEKAAAKAREFYSKYLTDAAGTART